MLSEPTGHLWKNHDSSKTTIAYGTYKGQTIALFPNRHKNKGSDPDYVIVDTVSKRKS